MTIFLLPPKLRRHINQAASLNTLLPHFRPARKPNLAVLSNFFLHTSIQCSSLIFMIVQRLAEKAQTTVKEKRLLRQFACVIINFPTLLFSYDHHDSPTPSLISINFALFFHDHRRPFHFLPPAFMNQIPKSLPSISRPCPLPKNQARLPPCTIHLQEKPFSFPATATVITPSCSSPSHRASAAALSTGAPSSHDGSFLASPPKADTSDLSPGPP